MLFGGALVAGAVTTSQSDWQPVGLLIALVILAVGSDLLALRVGGLWLSASFAAMMLACILLGPAPAMVVALAPILVNTVRERPSLMNLASNLATFATFPLVGGLLIEAVELPSQSDAAMAGLIMAIFMVTNFVNFCMIYGYRVLAEGWTWRVGFRDCYAPVVPAELAIGVVTLAIAVGERALGAEVVIVLAPIVLVCQWLLRTAIAAFERGVELQERNEQLAALQFGLISTTMKTLALRDRMTARHSAAVARYTREMAAELGLPDEVQELFHTAGLFHDIGKFIFPDSILFAATGLTDDQYEIVRRHPEVGADLIAEIEGYGPVAEIVRHHHERIDGRGYPAGLMDQEIPLGAKIIAIADVYDVITARDTYRQPVSTTEAFEELRRSAGTQLDAELVDVFIDMVGRRGLMFSHSSSDDFEAELGLERRVSSYAEPKVAA